MKKEYNDMINVNNPTHEAFLRGIGVPVELPHIERELTRLWGESAQEAGGSEVSRPSVTRVVLCNLVVLGRPERLDEVQVAHPCRAILLGLEEGRGQKVEAEVAATCHLPAPGRPQVCSEKIALFAAPEAQRLLPSAVRGLLEADLPVVVWWSQPPDDSERSELLAQLANDASRVLLDLPDPASDCTLEHLARFIEAHRLRYVHDLAWFGLTPWRDLIAQRFEPPNHRHLERLTSLTIRTRTAGDPLVNPPRISGLLAGWFAGQLGWTLEQRLQRPAAETHVRHPASTIDARYRDRAGRRVIHLTLCFELDPQAQPAQIDAVELEWEEPEAVVPGCYRIERVRPGHDLARLYVTSNNLCNLPGSATIPELDPTRRLLNALQASRNDPPFQAAWNQARQLLGPPDTPSTPSRPAPPTEPTRQS
ncbi:Glucose-6-phosphate dehydrogenase subunit [Isosphaera pallida ATCC 43644]|uniref:Glucose-6-phosphate dehydrogenase subunit n=2 Tax=Isosphaera pallida TaxID=128 RepID=E8R0A4_ISOPI|nr:Glucose-6-phosphate dehydrogenase subunit [Isosphaera pallida ATCC 43644]